MIENGQNNFSEITMTIHKLNNLSFPDQDRIGYLMIKHERKTLHNLI